MIVLALVAVVAATLSLYGIAWAVGGQTAKVLFVLGAVISGAAAVLGAVALS